MPPTDSAERSARLVDPHGAETIEVFGPTLQFLTPPGDGEHAPCVIRGTTPPGAVVPLHSHADPETFVALAGEFEGLVYAGEDSTWVRVRPGDVFHIPGGEACPPQPVANAGGEHPRHHAANGPVLPGGRRTVGRPDRALPRDF